MFLFSRINNLNQVKHRSVFINGLFQRHEGFTIVELMIAVTILVFVLAGAYLFFSFGWSSFDWGTDRAIVQNNLRLATEAITNEVRFAEGISIINTIDIPDPVEADYTYLFTNNEGRIEKKTENSSIIIPHELDNSINIELEFEKTLPNVLKVVIIETTSNTYLETEIRALNIPDSSSIENNSGNALQIAFNSGSGDNNDNVLATGITLNQNTMDLAIGTTGNLTAVFEPDNTTNQEVSWGSNEPGISTVDNGVVTGVAEGTAIITVTTVEGNYTDTCVVTVFSNSVSVTGVNLDQSTMTLTVGETTGTLVATVYPTIATNKSLTWTSSSEQVATVSGGVVTPVSSGTATVTANTVDGGYFDSCVVTVLEPAAPDYWNPDSEFPAWENKIYGGSGLKVTYNGNRYISRQWIAAGSGTPDVSSLWILQPLPNEYYPRWRSIEPYPSPDGQTRVIHDDKVFRAKWYVNPGVEPPSSPWELET